MTNDQPSEDGYLWTGAMSVDADEPGAIIGLVAEACPVAAPGIVQLSLHRATCPPQEHEGHLDFFISEGTARRLIEQLQRVVHRAEALRALHRTGSLSEGVVLDVQDLPAELTRASRAEDEA